MVGVVIDNAAATDRAITAHTTATTGCGVLHRVVGGGGMTAISVSSSQFFRR